MIKVRAIYKGALALLFCLAASSAAAQEITPVDVDTKKPEQPRLHYYDRHGNKLEEPVYFLTETDTVKKTSAASPWHRFNGVTVGVNFFDGIMQIAGQSYASYDANVAVSIYNWVFPTVEAGLGYSNMKEDGSTLRYHTKPSPYIKVGCDYNFLYKGTPDYKAGIGLRFGWAHPFYEITGATVSSPYWDQTQEFNITNQSVNAWFGEALAMVKVKIWRNLSMGWSIRYRFKIHIPDSSQSTPWFIPGYGGSSPISATFSIMYTFGSRKQRVVEPAA
ncbi:MAG: hypothetical protein J1E97_05255 [Muribaculaceae bacterium]|nr:hypothetical protein [Muribaculaceae bacterium]